MITVTLLTTYGEFTGRADTTEVALRRAAKKAQLPYTDPCQCGWSTPEHGVWQVWFSEALWTSGISTFVGPPDGPYLYRETVEEG